MRGPIVYELMVFQDRAGELNVRIRGNGNQLVFAGVVALAIHKLVDFGIDCAAHVGAHRMEITDRMTMRLLSAIGVPVEHSHIRESPGDLN